MNITELARRLRVNPEVLREKLPELGFDIGRRAIKVDQRLAQRIIQAWHEYESRQREEAEYRKTKKVDSDGVEEEKGNLLIPSVLTVRDFAQILDIPVTLVIKELMKNGVMASLNQRIDFDTAAIIAEDIGYTAVQQKGDESVNLQKDKRIKEILEKEKGLGSSRPPVIVVMGHVDHGKTKLLDTIRMTDVVAGESGGITQHIGAYQIKKKGRLITFIDTPGHEAFTAMRSRGAKVADIAILVVAANDGVKPQTIEARKIAEASGIPIVVAINKIDLPDADIEKTKTSLSQHKLLCEEWGGKIPCVPISAKKNENIDELLENVLLVADVEAKKLVANAEGEVVGSVIESHVDKGLGAVATILVKNGTLRKGDQVIVDGQFYGKIRLMHDYLGKEVKEAGPSTPVQVIGLKVAPKVGDVIEVSLEKVKKVKAYRLEKKEETFVQQRQEDSDDENSVACLNIVLRTDVLGSQEAIIESLEKLQTADVKIKFVTKGLGSISESDVLQAEATGALLVGFNVLPSRAAQLLAKEKGVDIKSFKVIYELIDAVKEKLNEIIRPEIVREDLGKAEVLQIFKTEDDNMIVGAKVLNGKVVVNSQAAVLRDDSFIVKGAITSLRVGKQDVTDVLKKQECGISFSGQPLIEVGDILDVYTEKEVKRFV